MNKKDSLLAALVLLVWGVNFFFMKVALTEISPMVLGLLRFALLLFPALFFIKRPAVKWYWLAAYGFTISFMQFGLTFSALAIGLPTGLTALLLQAQVFFTVLIASILWHEPVKPNNLAAMLIAAAGLTLIGIGQYKGSMPMLSVVLMLLAALSWAIGNIVVKKIGRINALSLVVWGNVVTIIPFTLCALWLHGAKGVAQQISAMSWRVWDALFFITYLSSLFGYSVWGSLLSRYPAGKITPLALFVPVVALLLGWLVLHEPLNLWHWIGVFTVMVALLVQVFGTKLFTRNST